MNRRELILGAGGLTLASALPLPSFARLDPFSTRPATPRLKAPLRLEAFEYRGVRLLPGMFQRQMETTRNLYLNLSNDDMLKGFRREAGLPHPGNDMGGWARRDSGATFGQWISGMARMSCATNDDAMRAKAVTLVEQWEKTIGPGGNCRMNTYAWEKMSCGLVDMALYADYDRALLILERITQWAMQTFDRSRSVATPLDRDGRKPHGTLEWYTLPENSYRAYLITGRPVFREFGDLWNYNSYWNKFENTSTPAGVAYLHSYSHVNTFCGAAMAYAITGDEHYLRILENAYDYVMGTQAYVTGGYGPGEWSVPYDGTLGSALEIRSDTAEIPCGSWAAFKLSRYLLGFTGSARYGEWMETMLYNGIGAALPVKPDGTAFYYADYRLDQAAKLYYWDEWPCCSGTYIQTVADYHNAIYFRNADGLYINLLVPSEATWEHRGQQVTVRQETAFPESGSSRLTVRASEPAVMGIHVRIPAWAKEVKLSVNGQPAAAEIQPGEWANVERAWRDGDTLQVEMDIPIYTVPVDKQHPTRSAVKYGPVLLAQDAKYSYPFALDATHTDVAGRFTRVSEDLRFTVSDIRLREQHTGDFQPFYAVEERVPYRTYFDLYAPRFL